MLCGVPPIDKYGVIYVATQRESGKQYVGQTIRSIEERWAGHCEPNKRDGQVIAKAIAKYGKDTFDVSMLDWASSKEELDHKEKFWIAFLDTRVPEGYNLKEGGANSKPHPDSVAKMAATKRGQKLPDNHPFKQKGAKPWNFRKMTPEQKEANRERALARYASGWVHPMKGKHHTEESRAKIKAKRAQQVLADDHPFRQKGNQWSKGMKHTPEQVEAHRQMMKAGYAEGRFKTNKGKSFPASHKAIQCIETGKIYVSMLEAAKELKPGRPMSRDYRGIVSSLGTAAKTGKIAYGFHWRYV